MNPKKALTGIVASLLTALSLAKPAQAGVHRGELSLQYGFNKQIISQAPKIWGEVNNSLDVKASAKGHDDSMAYGVMLNLHAQNPRNMRKEAIPLRTAGTEFLLGHSTQSEDNRRLQLLFAAGGELSRIRTHEVTGGIGNVVFFNNEQATVLDSNAHIGGKAVYAWPRAELYLFVTGGPGRTNIERDGQLTRAIDYSRTVLEAGSVIRLFPGRNKDGTEYAQELRPVIRLERTVGGLRSSVLTQEISYVSSLGSSDLNFFLTGYRSETVGGTKPVDMPGNGDLTTAYGGKFGVILKGDLTPKKKR